MKNTQKASVQVIHHWLNTTELLLIVSSLGGSVASVIFQQSLFATLASVPLSLALGLNSWERNRLDRVNQESQASLIRLEQQIQNWEHSNSLSSLIDAESKHGKSIQEISNAIQGLREEIHAISQSVSHLESIDQARNQATRNEQLSLDSKFSELERKIKDIASRIDALRIPEIEQKLGQLDLAVQNLQVELKSEIVAIREKVDGRIPSEFSELRNLYASLAKQVGEIQARTNKPPANQSKHSNQETYQVSQKMCLICKERPAIPGQGICYSCSSEPG